MLKFFRRLLFTVIGAVITAFLIVFLFFTGITIMTSMGSNDKAELTGNSILKIDLNGTIKERAVVNPFSYLLADTPFGSSTLGLNQILKNIKKAACDKRIVGVVLEAGYTEAGFVTIDEIRNALQTVRDSGKFVYAYASDYSQKGYYLASVADKVYLPPQGSVQYRGLHSETEYYKDASDKFGVEMQVVRHGKFKSAVEPYLLNKMSGAAREQTETYMNSIWTYVKNAISKSRGVSVEALDSLANNSSIFRDNKLLLDNHMIDGLKYKDQFNREIKELTGTSADENIKMISLSDYTSVNLLNERGSISKTKDEIAIVYAEGEIDGGASEGINSEDLSATIRKARNDKNIKAVVLRINSPGGSGAGADIIWREVSLCEKVKPVIVSMGDLAASGGYYIAACADTIVASPLTITGSIGVFGTQPNIHNLLTKTLGVHVDGVKTNKYADMPSLFRPMRADERAEMKASIERFYNVFLTRCAEGRNTSKEAIDKIGQGRVWSGENATHINLVDVLGGIDTAIEIAKEKAGLKDYKVKELPEQVSIMEDIFSGMKTKIRAFTLNSILGIDSRHTTLLNQINNKHVIQARLPYDLIIK